MGGRGGWIINHEFVVGGGGYGLSTDILVDGKKLAMGYGGLELGYVFFSDSLVHFTIHSLFGFGGISLVGLQYQLVSPAGLRFAQVFLGNRGDDFLSRRLHLDRQHDIGLEILGLGVDLALHPGVALGANDDHLLPARVVLEAHIQPGHPHGVTRPLLVVLVNEQKCHLQ